MSASSGCASWDITVGTSTAAATSTAAGKPTAAGVNAAATSSSSRRRRWRGGTCDCCSTSRSTRVAGRTPSRRRHQPRRAPRRHDGRRRASGCPGPPIVRATLQDGPAAAAIGTGAEPGSRQVLPPTQCRAGQRAQAPAPCAGPLRVPASPAGGAAGRALPSTVRGTCGVCVPCGLPTPRGACDSPRRGVLPCR